MIDKTNFFRGCIVIVVITLALIVMICVLAVPSIHNGHVEKVHRIDACKQANNISDCLRINR